MMVKIHLDSIGCYFLLHYCADMIIITQSLAKDLFRLPMISKVFSSSDIEIHRMQHSDHDGKKFILIPIGCYFMF